MLVRMVTKPEAERVLFLEFIARVTSHIPDKGQVWNMPSWTGLSIISS